MSWAYKIAILYLGFVAIILSLVFTCFGETIELESKDYYARELKFQGQIDASSNAKSLAEPIEHKVTGEGVALLIPAELRTADFKGEAYFFRPSDATLDKTLNLEPGEDGALLLKKEAFAKGVYRMRISISSGGKNYFKEEVINFR